MRFDESTYRITESGIFGRLALIAGMLGLALSAAGYFADSAQFFHSYLVAFVFWLTIALGGLFFTMLNHLVDAKWSIVLRRLGEAFMAVVPIMAIFAIPVLLGIKELFHWSHPEIVAEDEILQGKSAFLNTGFFIARMIIYFVVWSLLSYWLYRKSLKQDSEHSDVLVKRIRRVSAPGMILFALTITFASFDWLMSLDAHWYSTIFGVYVFSGCFLGFLAVLTLVLLQMQSSGVLAKEVTSEHHHDLGKLMFAFVIFWGYMAFSQYFLIWYGNIPEETIWFLHRWENSWKGFSLLLVFGQFVIPFFFLFPQPVKRNVTALKIVSVWLILMHWVDLYWVVMPSLHHHGVHLSWIDAATMLGIGGVFMFVFWNKLTAHPLLPVKDPGLEESMHFHNI